MKRTLSTIIACLTVCFAVVASQSFDRLVNGLTATASSASKAVFQLNCCTAGQQKTTICHRPPGNPSNAQEIEISCNGLNGHENHEFDTCGPCSQPTPTPTPTPTPVVTPTPTPTPTPPLAMCCTPGQQQVTICHRPPGNPTNAQEITISCNGLNGHENHELDTCGPCSTLPPTPTPTPLGGATPAPTPTPAGGGATPTPTPTPAGGGATPTPTPTPLTGGLGTPTPTPTPPTGPDVCPNLAGFQGTVPTGYQVLGGQCVVEGCEEGSFEVPLNTYGFLNTTQLPNGDLFLLGSQLSLRLTPATVKNGTLFSANPESFGPRIVPLMPSMGGVKIAKPNSSLTAISCLDNFRNINFVIAGQGVTEGDTVRLALQNPDNGDTKVLATFAVRGNGVTLTQLHQQANLFLNNRIAVGTTGRQALEAVIPYVIALTGGALRTELLTLELRGVPNSQLETCGQLVLEIMRSGASGETTVAFTDITVNRVEQFGDRNNPAPGLLMNLTGGFPTGTPCSGAVCLACAPVSTQTTPGCGSVCFRSPGYYLAAPNLLPTGMVLIGGVNFNVPVSIQNRRQEVLFALQGGFGMLSPLQLLNREFVAAQLAVQQRGFLAGPETLRLQLNCLNTSALPVTLSNGVRLTGESTLGELFEQARSSIINQRSVDMLILAGLFGELNNSDPFGLCR